MKIILFSGKAESGKSTAAKQLKKFLDKTSIRSAIIPCGHYVKDTASLVFDWDGKKDKAGRSVLQYVGDIVRAEDPLFWVDTVMRLAKVLNRTLDCIIIDDCRYPNEHISWIEKGYETMIIRIERPGHLNELTELQRNHSSETIMDDYSFNTVLTAMDEEELNSQVRGLFMHDTYLHNLLGLNNVTGLWAQIVNEV